MPLPQRHPDRTWPRTSYHEETENQEDKSMQNKCIYPVKRYWDPPVCLAPHYLRERGRWKLPKMWDQATGLTNLSESQRWCVCSWDKGLSSYSAGTGFPSHLNPPVSSRPLATRDHTKQPMSSEREQLGCGPSSPRRQPTPHLSESLLPHKETTGGQIQRPVCQCCVCCVCWTQSREYYY